MLKSRGYNLWSSQNCSKHLRLIILRQLYLAPKGRGMAQIIHSMWRTFNCNATASLLSYPCSKIAQELLSQHVKQISSIAISRANPAYTSGDQPINQGAWITCSKWEILALLFLGRHREAAEPLFLNAHLLCKSSHPQMLHFQFWSSLGSTTSICRARRSWGQVYSGWGMEIK